MSIGFHKMFDCVDCQVNTNEIGEYYMVEDEVWEQAFGGVPDAPGMLCIGDLEKRIGRKLTSDDFIDAPINRLDDDFNFFKSERLVDRLTSK